MIWVGILSVTSFLLLLFGCWLTVSRVRKFREDAEESRAKAFAEMMEIAGKNADAGTRGRGEREREAPGPGSRDPGH